jgi:hypothetical protein
MNADGETNTVEIDYIIHREPLEIGGHTVTAMIGTNYAGPCSVQETGRPESKAFCAFPDFVEAARAARYASTPDGGYGSVVIMPCESREITHTAFEDWAF